MNQRAKTPRIIAGVDGSPSSRMALAWAVGQAECTGAQVDAVTAWQYPQFYGSMGWTVPQGGEEAISTATEEVLQEAVAEATRGHPNIVVHTTVTYGGPSEVLLKAAEGADLLVVGSRGHGAVAGALLGSVGHNCAQHAPCPVVIVRHVA